MTSLRTFINDFWQPLIIWTIIPPNQTMELDINVTSPLAIPTIWMMIMIPLLQNKLSLY